MEGLPALDTIFKTRKSIIEDEAWGLAIMPGSGINGTTLPKLLRTFLPLNLREVHLSGGRWMQSEMTFKRSGMGLGAGKEGEMAAWRTDEQEIRLVRDIADEMWREYYQLNATPSPR
jgi:copper homeostasis protein